MAEQKQWGGLGLQAEKLFQDPVTGRKGVCAAPLKLIYSLPLDAAVAVVLKTRTTENTSEFSPVDSDTLHHNKPCP